MSVDEFTIAGGSGQLRARRYRPAGRTGTAMPTQLWCHGGGFVAGTIDEILGDRLTADRARDANLQIVSLEYRLAPEHPYPAAVDDVVAALADLRARADELDVDADRLGVGGNSAGALVAATAALRERDAGRPLRHQALEVPPATLRDVGESSRRYAIGFGLDDAREVAALYRGAAPVSEVSPLDHSDHRDVAPALLLVAQFDPLRDGALAYADALCAAGVATEVRLGAGHVHASPGLTAGFDRARRWQSTFAAELALAYRTT